LGENACSETCAQDVFDAYAASVERVAAVVETIVVAEFVGRVVAGSFIPDSSGK
jgi:hypothetical protein